MGNKSKKPRDIVELKDGTKVKVSWRRQRNLAGAGQVRTRSSWAGMKEKTISPKISLLDRDGVQLKAGQQLHVRHPGRTLYKSGSIARPALANHKPRRAPAVVNTTPQPWQKAALKKAKKAAAR